MITQADIEAYNYPEFVGPRTSSRSGRCCPSGLRRRTSPRRSPQASWRGSATTGRTAATERWKEQGPRPGRIEVNE